MDNDIRQRYRRDYTKEPITTKAHALSGATLPQEQPTNTRTHKRKGVPSVFKKWAGLIFGLAVVILVVYVIWRLAGASASLVPANILSAADFPVYYPDQSKLPAGYSLDNSSFKQAQPGVIVYSVNNPNGGILSVSEEAQPGGSVISDFTKKSIPLHTSFNSSFGQAEIGAVGQPPNLRTVVSLPINKGPWLIITAPADTAQADLKQIIQSLKR